MKARARARVARDDVRVVHIEDMDADEIIRGLWQGALRRFQDSEVAINGISTAVVLAPDANCRVVHPLDVHRVGMTDDFKDWDLRPLPRLRELSKHLARKIKRGRSIATFCFEGRNRSGLLSALIVRRLTGVTGAEAARIVRDRRRADALTNPVFMDYLMRLGPGR